MRKQYKNKGLRGFTLVELSIVIVIIGFLVAGIAAGTSLIEEAKMRSIVTDFDTFKTAFNGFNAKYAGVPGDTKNGDAFFPNCGDTPGDCVGNNDGSIVAANTIGGVGADEVRPALRELALASLINAGIPQLVDGATLGNPTFNLVPGVNAPASRISGAGYFFSAMIDSNGTPHNAIVLGAANSVTGLLDNPALTNGEALELATKLGAVFVADNEATPLERLLGLTVSNSYAFKGGACGGNQQPHLIIPDINNKAILSMLDLFTNDANALLDPEAPVALKNCPNPNSDFSFIGADFSASGLADNEIAVTVTRSMDQ